MPLGTGNAPRAEALRLRGPLLPLFASSEVESLLDDPQQPVLSTPVFGLGGPDGPLPYAYQEWLQQRARQKDHAPAEFLDLFQHRLLSLLYRVLRIAWRSVSRCRRRPRCRRSYAPSAACCRKPCKSARRCRTARYWHAPRCSPAGVAPGRLRRPGAPAFRRGGRLDVYQGAWKEIPAASRSRLQRGGRNLRLGRDAIAGTRTWDEHAGIALSLGPLDAREAARFFPTGRPWPVGQPRRAVLRPRPGLSPEPAGERRRAAAPGARCTAQAELEHRPAARRRRPAAAHRSRPAAAGGSLKWNSPP
ncbi:type VI secretion system baseplate subunit TssG [Pseudomonas aeruginosa]|nr:type VI secretion system baseplate subunit TssG [Pseudomonas aeruginosa]